MIKIPGKTFDDLSLGDVGVMIETDSSISPRGNEYFQVVLWINRVGVIDCAAVIAYLLPIAIR
jgi:hypothetical protein